MLDRTDQGQESTYARDRHYEVCEHANTKKRPARNNEVSLEQNR